MCVRGISACVHKFTIHALTRLLVIVSVCVGLCMCVFVSIKIVGDNEIGVTEAFHCYEMAKYPLSAPKARQFRITKLWLQIQNTRLVKSPNAAAKLITPNPSFFRRPHVRPRNKYISRRGTSSRGKNHYTNAQRLPLVSRAALACRR